MPPKDQIIMSSSVRMAREADAAVRRIARAAVGGSTVKRADVAVPTAADALDGMLLTLTLPSAAPGCREVAADAGDARLPGKHSSDESAGTGETLTEGEFVPAASSWDILME